MTTHERFTLARIKHHLVHSRRHVRTDASTHPTHASGALDAAVRLNSQPALSSEDSAHHTTRKLLSLGNQQKGDSRQ